MTGLLRLQRKPDEIPGLDLENTTSLALEDPDRAERDAQEEVFQGRGGLLGGDTAISAPPTFGPTKIDSFLERASESSIPELQIPAKVIHTMRGLKDMVSAAAVDSFDRAFPIEKPEIGVKIPGTARHLDPFRAAQEGLLAATPPARGGKLGLKAGKAALKKASTELPPFTTRLDSGKVRVGNMAGSVTDAEARAIDAILVPELGHSHMLDSGVDVAESALRGDVDGVVSGLQKLRSEFSGEGLSSTELDDLLEAVAENAIKFNPSLKPGTRVILNTAMFGKSPALKLSAGKTAQAAEPDVATVAFHGTGGRPEFKEFELSKIGTGEGSQAFGRGLYFAESEGVARSYVTNAGTGQIEQLARAQPVLSRKFKEQVLAVHQANGWPDPDLNQLADVALQIKRGRITRSEFPQITDDVVDFIKQNVSDDTGLLYEVRIKRNPEEFLDWDKPLSEQTSHVREALERAGIAPSSGAKKLSAAKTVDEKSVIALELQKGDFPGVGRGQPFDLGGREIVGSMNRHFLDQGMSVLAAEKATSAALLEAGIPGIRYLDQGSRAAGGRSLVGEFRGARTLQDWRRVAREAFDDPIERRVSEVVFHNKFGGDPTDLKRFIEEVTSNWPELRRGNLDSGGVAKPTSQQIANVIDAVTSEGTRNIVVFDQKIIETISINGKGTAKTKGLLGIGAAAAASTQMRPAREVDPGT
jgi:hypothetical protein